MARMCPARHVHVPRPTHRNRTCGARCWTRQSTALQQTCRCAGRDRAAPPAADTRGRAARPCTRAAGLLGAATPIQRRVAADGMPWRPWATDSAARARRARRARHRAQVATGWQPLFDVAVPQQLWAAMERQRGACEAVIASKDALVAGAGA